MCVFHDLFEFDPNRLLNFVLGRSETPLNNKEIFLFVLIFMWLVYVWEVYLDYRQYKVVQKHNKVPDELHSVLNDETFAKAREYSSVKIRAGFLFDFYGEVETTLILVYGLMPLLWNYCGQRLSNVAIDAVYKEILQSSLFLIIGTFVTTLTSLPIDYYKHFVIEERFGFNKQTRFFYFKDLVKKFIVTQVLMQPIIGILIWIIHWGGDYFFLYCWVFTVCIALFLATIYPEVIAPLFDKYTPLKEGKLREMIEEMARKVSFPLTKIFVVDGSTRSTHSNAYLYGFCNNKRIVLFDTLLEEYQSEKAKKEEEKKKKEEENAPKEEGQEEKKEVKEETKEKQRCQGCTNDEVVAVLAHEIGHWHHSHTIKNLVISQAYIFLCYFLFAMLFKNREIYLAFGFTDGQPVFIGLLLIFSHVLAPLSQVVSFFMQVMSRHFEYQADGYAVRQGYSDLLASALVKLNLDNLGFPIYDPLYSSYHHSHPPLMQRLKTIKSSTPSKKTD